MHNTNNNNNNNNSNSNKLCYPHANPKQHQNKKFNNKN